MRQPIDFFDWFHAGPRWSTRPWLVLGKGPSFAKLADYDVGGFNVFSLNHVVRQAKVDVAHAIDIEVIRDCADILDENARYLLMPWHPNMGSRPQPQSLEHWCAEIPELRAFADEGRLLWYNRIGTPPRGSSPAVSVQFFSAEAPYALLGAAGVRKIRSLGIDGGSQYAAAFHGLDTLLANGRSSFDCQFDEIAASIVRYQLDAAPLDACAPVRVYVAAMPEQMLAVKVLEYSIRKHASMTVEVIPLHTLGIPIPEPRHPDNRARTPFSFQRFLIPEAAGYEGRAIYLDSDMQVCADISQLWRLEMEGNSLLSVSAPAGSARAPQYSVMLLDCAKLDWKIDRIVELLDRGVVDYKGLMADMCLVSDQSASIDPEWNSLEAFTPGRTRLIHYTDMDTQPWINANHPFGAVWVRDLIEAVRGGFITLDEIRDHASRGWIRPSLVHQVENGIESTALVPPRVLALDRRYAPPYRKLPHMRGRAALAYPRYVLATAEDASKRAAMFALARAKAIKRRWMPR